MTKNKGGNKKDLLFWHGSSIIEKRKEGDE
jgi:hypothetical protein